MEEKNFPRRKNNLIQLSMLTKEYHFMVFTILLLMRNKLGLAISFPSIYITSYFNATRFNHQSFKN